MATRKPKKDEETGAKTPTVEAAVEAPADRWAEPLDSELAGLEVRLGAVKRDGNEEATEKVEARIGDVKEQQKRTRAAAKANELATAKR